MARLYFIVLAALVMAGCHKATTAPAVVTGATYNFSYAYVPPTGAATEYTFSFATTAPAGSTLLWSFGDGGTATDAAPQHIYFGTGYYYVSLMVNGDSAHIVGKALFVSRYLPAICSYTGAPLTDSPLTFHSNLYADSTVLWDFGDGTTATDTAPVHAFHAPGTYSVKLTINGHAATAVTTTVVISAAPAYTALITNVRTWHDTTYNVRPAATTAYPQPDTPFALIYINPAQVTYFGRSLYFVPAASNATMLQFASSFLNSGGDTDSMVLQYFHANDSAHMEHLVPGASAVSKEDWTTP